MSARDIVVRGTVLVAKGQHGVVKGAAIASGAGRGRVSVSFDCEPEGAGYNVAPDAIALLQPWEGRHPGAGVSPPARRGAAAHADPTHATSPTTRGPIPPYPRPNSGTRHAALPYSSPPVVDGSAVQKGALPGALSPPLCVTACVSPTHGLTTPVSPERGGGELYTSPPPRAPPASAAAEAATAQRVSALLALGNAQPEQQRLLQGLSQQYLSGQLAPHSYHACLRAMFGDEAVGNVAPELAQQSPSPAATLSPRTEQFVSSVQRDARGSGALAPA